MIVTTKWFPFDLDVLTDDVVFFAFGNLTSSLERPDPPKPQRVLKSLAKRGLVDLQRAIQQHPKRDELFVVGYTEDGIYSNEYEWTKFPERGTKFPEKSGRFAQKIGMTDLLISTYRGCGDLYMEYGAKVFESVPPSCCHSFLRPVAPDSHKWDVVFVGNYAEGDPRYGDRMPVVRALHEASVERGFSFAIFGDGWGEFPVESGFSRDRFADRINDTKIAVTLHRAMLNMPWWDACWSDSIAKTMASSGCLAVCDEMPCHREFFGDEMVTFSDTMELVEKVLMYLADDRKRSELARLQYAMVKAKFTRAVRANEVLELIRKHAPGRLA